MAGIPQVITEDRASGAQVVEGSLNFDNGYLTRTPSSIGNRKTFTWSAWIKRTDVSSRSAIWGAGTTNGSNNPGGSMYFNSSTGTLQVVNGGGTVFSFTTSSYNRDTSWYHIVIAINTSGTPRIAIYINGEQATASGTIASSNFELDYNNTIIHAIGSRTDDGALPASIFKGRMTQVYMIDGQALGPENFGYTDPLTNTWRPKKYTRGVFEELDKFNTYTFGEPQNQLRYQGIKFPSAAGGTVAWKATGSSNTGLNLYTSTDNSNWTRRLSNQTVDSTNGLVYESSDQYVILVNGSDTNWSNQLQLLSDVNGATIHYSNGTYPGNGSPTMTWSGPTYTDGTIASYNSFYLPMDGKASIGKDQSGNGNDWTPVNFGGSVELSKATGAAPILKTNEAGTVGKPGVRTDKKTYAVTAVGGKYVIDEVQQPVLNAYRGGSYIFDYTAATSHPFYLSSLPDGKHNSKAYSSRLYRSGGYLDLGTGHTDLQPGSGDFCIELYVNLVNQGANFPVFVDTRVSGAADANGFFWGIRDADNRMYLYTHGNTRIYADHSLTTGKWYHLALTRQSGTFRMFIDGSQVGGSYSQSQNYSNQIRYIGHSTNSEVQTWYIDAYISNFRFVKGEAVYTTNFTPPQTTLTTTSQGVSSSNVKLLCCQDSSPTTAVVSPGTITLGQAGSDAVTSVNTHNPFLYNSVHGNFGLNLATSNTTKITIPHTAADTLYYYCQNHSGMGSSINVTTDIRKADPYAWKNIISMPLNNVADESGSINVNQTSQTVTNSNTSFTGLSNFYGSTASFTRSSSNFLSVPDSAGIELGRDDFTIEFWLYLNNTTNHYEGIISKPGNADAQAAPMIYKETSGNIHINFSEAESNNWNIGQFIGHCAQLAFKWHHVAVTRSKDTFRWFLDGVLVKAQTSANFLYDNGNPLYIGKYTMFPGSNTYGFDGYLQDFRLYKGVAKYLGNIGDQVYIPASTNPDILPDTPSGIASKTNLTKITDGAVSFDGANDYLSIGPSSDFDMDGDFTAEAWVYPTSHANDYAGIFGFSHDSDTAGWNVLVRSGSGRLHMNVDMTYTDVTGSLSLNKWTHVALVRSGTGSGNCKLYIDGVADPTTLSVNNTTGTPGTTGCYIGSYPGYETAREFAGFISNARVIKGTALYTSNFTPPTEPLTEVTNTKLLCCQSNTSVTAAAVSPGAVSAPDGGYAFNRAKLYSTFGAGTRSANYTVEYSDDNSNWTTAFTGTMTTSGCGLVTASGGGGNYGKHPYWRYTNNEGTGSHHPRMARIVLSDGTTDVNIQTFTGDNCSDQGTIPGNGTSYTYTDSTYAINNASATNFNPFTDDINAIRGQETGYATFNPLMKGANTTLSNGNLTVSSSGTTFDGWVEGTITIPKTGKWFVEFTAGSLPSSTYYGMYNVRTWNPNGFSGVGFFGLQVNSGNKLKSTGSGAYMPAASFGDVVGVMYDADNNTLGFMNNGVNYGVAFDSSDGIDYTDDHRVWWNTNGATTFSHTINFGQKPFKFPPPDGFQPLNFSTVQPEKVFARPDQYIGVTLYTGSGETVSPRTIELPHAADLVWAKSRDRSSSHQLADTVRGNNSVLRSNSNSNAQNPTTQFNGGGISIIDGKTISLVKGSTNQANNENLNATGQKGLVWSWKAGGSSNTFNIDDVGYANASDVNMNVGAFDSSTFLKGQVWSGLMSAASGSFDQAASRAFDGFLRTDPNRLRTSGNQVLVTMNLSSTPVTVSSQIKVYAEPGYNSSCTVTVGGVTHTSSTGALHTFNVSGSLTQMTLQSTQSGGRTYMEGMEIDGKLLVDDNTTVNAPSVDSTGCSVGTKQGFSIVAYNATGSNLRVSHGLSERPGFIILKSKNVSGDWLVWHQNLNGVDRFLKLNDGQAQAQADNVFLSVDSNTFGTGDDAGINSSNQQKISYIWHDVPGLQKFGKYVGNASADGTFIELGFKPAIVWTKRIDSGSNWLIHDSARDPSNPVYGTLWGNLSNIEGRSNVCIDMTSSGFKHRNADGGTANNHSGASYIYCAWAEAPTVNLYGGHANAR